MGPLVLIQTHEAGANRQALQKRSGMTAGTEGTVDKDPTPLRLEQIQAFFE